MILNVNKPKGFTSRDVVNILSKHFNTKKVGHTGTLDPIASGVLIICSDEDTKLVELLTSESKEYLVEMKLGIKTDTGDITGNILEEKEANIKDKEIKDCIDDFTGEYTQEVPIYSAVKVKGKKLYEYARNNEKVDLPKRQVFIYNNRFIKRKNDLVKFRVVVSKGTYIRSLINDICSKLNTVGTMTELVRMAQGPYLIDNSNTIEDIQNNSFTTISRNDVLKDYPFQMITEDNKRQILNGSLISKTFSSKYIVYTDKSEIRAIYQEYPKDKELAKPYIIFK